MKILRKLTSLVIPLVFLVSYGMPVALAATNPQTPVTKPATVAPTPQTNTAGEGSSAENGTFVPLTQLPGIQDVASADTLPNFLNQLYKILIGAGTVLAVIMIMVAGVQFMTSQGSVMSNQKAKARIQNAVLGLVLLLSPTIVFSIINPDILNLNLDVSKLTLKDLAFVDTSGHVDGVFTGADTMLWQNTGVDKDVDARRCAATNGSVEYRCLKGSVHRVVSKSDTCLSGETSLTVCKAPAGSPSTGNQCSAKYSPDKYIFSVVPVSKNSEACNTSGGVIAVPHGCCTNNNVEIGYGCCATPKSILAPSAKK